MEIWDLIIPLGIASYGMLIIMLLTGMKIIKTKVKIHRKLGILTFILATFHAGIIIYTSYF